MQKLYVRSLDDETPPRLAACYHRCGIQHSPYSSSPDYYRANNQHLTAHQRLCTDIGRGFENTETYRLREIMGYKNSNDTVRASGQFGVERVHSTFHGMLAMHSAINQGDLASLWPGVPLALALVLPHRCCMRRRFY